MIALLDDFYSYLSNIRNGIFFSYQKNVIYDTINKLLSPLRKILNIIKKFVLAILSFISDILFFLSEIRKLQISTLKKKEKDVNVLCFNP